MLKNNPSLKQVKPVGKFKEHDWDDYPNEDLKNDIVDFLNQHLPTMWPEDPFVGKVTSKGLNDAWIIEYPNLKEFAVDSDKYRICVTVKIVGDEAVLYED